MMTTSFTKWILYFVLYSVVGWICETIYCSIPAKKFVKRGFLAGPYCPIYGFGAVIMLLFMSPLAKQVHSLPILFILCVLSTSALEYFTGWLLEKLFHIRLWDYSNMKFHIRGRVCLLNSTLFGIMGVLLLWVIHPFFSSLIEPIGSSIKTAVASLLFVVLLIDLIITLDGLYKLESKVKTLWSSLETIARQNKAFRWDDKLSLEKNIGYLEDLALSGGNQKTVKLVAEIRHLLKEDHSGKRILSAFGNATHARLQNELLITKEALAAQKTSLKAIIARHTEKIKEFFAAEKENVAQADDTPQVVSFAAGINFHKLVWVFFIACFVGFVVETLYCLVTRGYIESRQGMLYGPFSQIYGFGAVFMVLLLHKAAQKSDRWVFFGGMLIGGVFEYVCSIVQEMAFGSVSWDYEGQMFSFGGRTSLVFMFFWGILAVFFIKHIYPRISSFIEKIPNRQGVVFSWIIVIFLTANMLLSAAAVYRWSQRLEYIPPSNPVEAFLDRQYPNEYLEEVYPNMTFISTGKPTE